MSRFRWATSAPSLADERVHIYSIPGSFSRVKEKKGRQGKVRKAGKLRNTCQFHFPIGNRPIC